MKKMWLAVFAACLLIPGAVATASAQGPAPAAMPAGLDCVRTHFSPDEWRAFGQLILELGSREDPRIQPMQRAVEACGNELSWSDEKRQLAGMFIVATAGAAAVREELARQDIHVEQLDRTILADRQLTAVAENGTMDSVAGEAFATRHYAELQRIARGRPLAGELGGRIGNYVAFRLLLDVKARQFGRAR